MVTQNRVNIDSDKGLLPDGKKHYLNQYYWLLNCLLNNVFKLITKTILKPRITGSLRRESTGHRWILFTKESFSRSCHHYGYWLSNVPSIHDDVIKWKHFPRYWLFVRGIYRSPVSSQHKGQWRGALIFSLICTWINNWVNNGEAGDLRRYNNVIVIST